MKTTLVNIATIFVILVIVIAGPFIIGALAGICAKGFNWVCNL